MNINKYAQQALDALYDAAIKPPGGIQISAHELAEEYMNKNDSIEGAVVSLIRWQAAKMGVTGFAAGLPGLMVLPVTLPAELTALWYTQLRMVAAIACLYGHDPKDDVVRTIAYLSLLGSSAIGTASKAGVIIGHKTAMAALKKLPGKVLFRVNRLVGYRLVTKFGEKGVVNLVKLVPIAGGLVSGTINLTGTQATGYAARLMLRPA